MMVTELVSVIIPTFNRAHLIGETIESVLNQTYTNWELIIVDDGSEDDTKSVVERYKEDKIQYISVPHSGKIGKVRNIGILQSKGDWIAFHDSDDLWIPEKLQFQMDLVNKYQDVSFLLGHGEQFGEGAIAPPVVEKEFKGDMFLPIVLDNRFVFCVPTMLFKKDVIRTVGLLNEDLRLIADYDFLLRMSSIFEGIFNNKIIARSRKHGQSTSDKLQYVAYEEHIAMVKRFAEQKMLTRSHSRKILSMLYYKAGLLNLVNKRSDEAVEKFSSYVRLQPLHYKGWIRLMQSYMR